MKAAAALLILLAVLAGQQQTAAAELGRRFGRHLVQENRIGDGAGNILHAVGLNQEGDAVAGVSDADDGDLTNDLAATGQDVGQLMLDTIPAAGQQVPGRRRLLQPGGPGKGGPGGGGGGGGGNQGGGNQGAGGIATAATNDVTGDVNQVGQETSQLAGDTTSNLGLGNPAGGVNTGTGAGSIAGAAAKDVSGDATQVSQEGTQLEGDTVSNSEKATGRRLHQNAGTGAGCNSIFSDFDTSTGEGTENAENNIAGDLGGHPVAGGATGRRRLHQNAGTGAGCDAIFSDGDTSTGEGTENAENNIAGDINGAKQPAGRKLLQENRIGDGAGNILHAVGLNQEGDAVAGVSDADDGDLTNDLAATGQDVGQLMLDTIPAAGQQVPGRK